MSRQMHNFIEDVPSRLNGTAPNSGPFVATNLPCVAFAACQSAKAEHLPRRYCGCSSATCKQVDERRQLYVESFRGNFDLDFATVAVFNTSSLIQDGPGANVQDPNRLGPLFEDRPHIFKVFTSYAVTDRVTASGYLRVQSGTPWARGPRLAWRSAELSRARRQPPQSDLGESRFDGGLPPAGQRPGGRLTRSAFAERREQSDASVDRFAAISGSANGAGTAVHCPLSAVKSLLRDRQRLRAPAAPPRRGGGEFLGVRGLRIPTQESGA